MAARKTKSGLAAGLAKRRAEPASFPGVQGESRPWDVLRQRPSEALDRIDYTRTAEMLSNDIAVALGAELEDLDTSHHGFRSALRRMFVRVLRMSIEKTERVVLFHEAVPGYTLMLFKKDAWEKQASPATEHPPLTASAEGRAAAVLMEEYAQRTGKRVLVIEHVDSLFVFFPAADLRRNVRELGYFALD